MTARTARTHQAEDRGVQAGDRRQAGELGVGHPLRHQQRGQDQPGDHVLGQPARPVGRERGESRRGGAHPRAPPGRRRGCGHGAAARAARRATSLPSPQTTSRPTTGTAPQTARPGRHRRSPSPHSPSRLDLDLTPRKWGIPRRPPRAHPVVGHIGRQHAVAVEHPPPSPIGHHPACRRSAPSVGVRTSRASSARGRRRFLPGTPTSSRPSSAIGSLRVHPAPRWHPPCVRGPSPARFGRCRSTWPPAPARPARQPPSLACRSATAAQGRRQRRASARTRGPPTHRPQTITAQRKCRRPHRVTVSGTHRPRSRFGPFSASRVMLPTPGRRRLGICSGRPRRNPATRDTDERAMLELCGSGGGSYPPGDLEALKQDRRCNAGREGTTRAHRSSWSRRRRWPPPADGVVVDR